MALGSGSSFSTDCWTRRRGFPSSEKLLKVGKASLISTSTHHRSPPPNQDWPRLPSSVGRAFFFSFVEGIGGGDPTFRSLPTNSKQTRQSSPDGFPRDAFVGYPFLEGSLCSHLKRPQATVVAELPRGAVEHPRNRSALSSSKAERVRLGREEPASRAPSPRSLKAWMASRTYSREPHPNERAIVEARSPLSLARMIWARRMTKASLERSAVSKCSFSVSESERTKMGGLMVFTIASHTIPVLDMH